jgi:lysozyme
VRRTAWRLMALAAAAAAIALALRAACIRLHLRAAERYPVRGIDVSNHQGPIDWSRVRAGGIAFALIKATEGSDFRDQRFAENWRESARAGIARAAYHYFTFCSDGAAQAIHFLSVVPPEPDVLPPAVDVEYAGNCKSPPGVERIRAELRVFLERIESAWSRKPILYVTRQSRWRIVDGHIEGYPLWIRSVWWPLRRGSWLLWQYSDTGRVDGIRGPVDLDVYSGTVEEWIDFSARGDTPPR